MNRIRQSHLLKNLKKTSKGIYCSLGKSPLKDVASYSMKWGISDVIEWSFIKNSEFATDDEYPLKLTSMVDY